MNTFTVPVQLDKVNLSRPLEYLEIDKDHRVNCFPATPPLNLGVSLQNAVHTRSRLTCRQFLTLSKGNLILSAASSIGAKSVLVLPKFSKVNPRPNLSSKETPFLKPDVRRSMTRPSRRNVDTGIILRRRSIV